MTYAARMRAAAQQVQRWPHADRSRFVTAGGLRWHVQVWDAEPVLPMVLLVHGTGASSHSWRDLAPLLAGRFTVIAPDLPGQGFSEAPDQRGLSLPGMARGLAALLAALEARPAIAVGHSAGAAIVARMCLDGAIAPRALVSLNGALLPVPGMPRHVFGPIARLLMSLPLVPQLFSWRAADRGTVGRLIRGTGSQLDAEGIELYARLMRNTGHVAATLGMMANWNLAALERDLPRLKPALTLVVGEHDRAIPPSEAARVRRLLPGARIVRIPDTGHLTHEERPQAVAEVISAQGAEGWGGEG